MRIATAVLVSCFVVYAASAQAQNPPAPPAPTHDAPAMGGKPSALPKPHVIGLRANEFLLSGLFNAPVETATSKPIDPTTHALLYSGQGLIPQNPKIGTIEDVVIDPRGVVTDVILKTSSGHTAGIAFSTLKSKGEPNPSFVTSLSPDAVAKAPAANTHKNTKGGMTGRGLLGRHVQVEKGGEGGTVVNLVIERGTGVIDYAVIRSATPLGPGIGKTPRAIIWKAVHKPIEPPDKSLRLSIDQAQLDGAPVFGLVAQQRPQDRKVDRSTGAATPSQR